MKCLVSTMIMSLRSSREPFLLTPRVMLCTLSAPSTPVSKLSTVLLLCTAIMLTIITMYLLAILSCCAVDVTTSNLQRRLSPPIGASINIRISSIGAGIPPVVKAISETTTPVADEIYLGVRDMRSSSQLLEEELYRIGTSVGPRTWGGFKYKDKLVIVMDTGYEIDELKKWIGMEYLLDYSGSCVAVMTRHSYVLIVDSFIKVLVNMIRVPDWTLEASGREMRVMSPSYHPGFYLSQAQHQENILVTGVAGFIGTHVVVRLLNEGFLGDIRNKADLEKLFSKNKFAAVANFANNLIGSITLYSVMAEYYCNKLFFASSATVYGHPEKIPCVEDFELKAMSACFQTKFFLQEIARDIQKADTEWNIILMRYSSPFGAHESAKLGEDRRGIPNIFGPYIQQVAVGRTEIRDYIPVTGLVNGHVVELQRFLKQNDIGCVAYILGTGKGKSVQEMVPAFERASGKKITLKMCPRWPVDATAVYASTENAEKKLGWKSNHDKD